MAGLGEGDKEGHEEEGDEGFDLDSGLWIGVEAGEGKAGRGRGLLADVDVTAAEGCVCVEGQGVWGG